MILDIVRLALFPALMAFAAASDLFTMTISNRVSLALALTFYFHSRRSTSCNRSPGRISRSPIYRNRRGAPAVSCVQSLQSRNDFV